MPSNNVEMLQIVANGLGKLKDEMVFVGGAVAELYADDPAASDIRPTQDVDCVIELSSRTAHAKLEENLRAIGFSNDISEGAPICRWVYKDILVDIMPTDSDILGFSNRWYSEGIENKITKLLPNGTEIFVFLPEYYLAAKFEAHIDRGGSDLRTSHDFEDIIYVLNNNIGIIEHIKNANESVKTYLTKEFKKLLANNGLIEGVECALPYGSGDESVDLVKDTIGQITNV